jgi:hypothetical protein
MEKITDHNETIENKMMKLLLNSLKRKDEYIHKIIE